MKHKQWLDSTYHVSNASINRKSVNTEVEKRTNLINVVFLTFSTCHYQASNLGLGSAVGT